MTATENIGVEELEAQVEGNEEVLDEGDVAADYLEELLDIADLDGDIDIEIRGGRTYISIVTDEDDVDLENLVGKDGEVLDALQELTRLAVLNATGERSRLILDIAGYRADRAEQLTKIAQDAIEGAKQSGEPVHLEPMSAYERKLVHDVIADAGLHSESEGESTRRHIVVSTLDS
ncbi:single-stranded DNA-binding protein [Glutamicibacter uratoxydans]|uniref:Single-stranded DNA-binding protein n=1 Tax=Glutamicibacter uratoxydans TaxID=43667 RepID=A0A4Y4DRM8_GLUUR|nr:R3H domain-containing nucleic acid-binding protein [Glutamicibacter uratoxydans]GED06028.1 single-stranded DNA-binding protein [Glutamicibacter uratoxydans]